MIHFTGDAPELFTDSVPTPSYETESRCGFSSPAAMVAWLRSKEATENPRPWARMGRVNGEQSPEFFGVSFDRACELATTGWQEGVDRAAKLRDLITAKSPIAPRLARYDVVGAYANVPRFISGDPLYMRRLDNVQARRRPTLVIAAHYGALAYIEADSMIRRATAVAAVIDAIEAAGFSCELIAYTISKDSGTERVAAATACRLKDAGDALDLAQVAFGLGHPAMLRRLTFAARASRPEASPLTSSYGSTRYEGLEMPHGCYMLPAIQNLGEGNFSSDDQTARTGVATLIASLRSQDCPAFPREDTAAA